MTTLSFNTRVGLGSEIREPMIELLNQQLADSVDLWSQAKHAHWNLKGPQFFQLHLLFDKLAAEVAEFVDLIAERVTVLGGYARGTIRMAALTSRLPEYPQTALLGGAVLEALAMRLSRLCASSRTAIEIAEARGDAGTADVFTQVSRGLDTSLWFLEAHLQS